ncbi:MAG: aminotransferase class I/II-fold pyridoxal phosphate-dependent enzyme [Gemmatimonadales bacterium]|nr:MAG: aminotransferase class I/II-fold pyridoxal phosphate-dependent enzyme [Gemmatimonadales bacterium]
MLEAILAAETGDDCFGEDPTVRRLEERVADLLGKERALYFPSGIMANQAGILAQGEAGTEVLAEARAHLVHYEEGSVAAHGGMSLRGVPTATGLMTPDELRAALRPPSPYHPRVSILALENTHLDSGGRVHDPEEMVQVAEVAREAGLSVHLDGARLWNAAAALHLTPDRVAAPADTVMTCLSKGLGAPVGSMLAGPAPVVERAWRIRRRLGGQMRQAGLLAAAGLHALEHQLPRMHEDHARARRLAHALSALPGLRVVPPETNVVMVDVSGTARAPGHLLEALAREGVGMVPFGATRIRAVLHREISDAQVEEAGAAAARILQPD